jgi:hypothetical protein
VNSATLQAGLADASSYVFALRHSSRFLFELFRRDGAS